MPRAVRFVILAGLLVLFGAGDAWAQATYPLYPQIGFRRSEHFPLNWVKIAACWLTLLVWVSTANWANIDAQRHRFKYARWNSILVFPFATAFLLLFLIPWFMVSYPLLVLTYLIPAILYVRHRNGQLLPHEQVMTWDHIRFLVAVRLNELGFKIKIERKMAYEEGPPLQLTARGAADEMSNQANQILARQSPGFVMAREMMADAMAHRADSVMMDFTQSEVSIRYQVDGVWHQGEARDRESGDMILAVLKKLANLNPEDRRGRQQGEVAANVEKKKYTLKFASQGTQTGERALVTIDDGVMKFKKLPDLGMREKLQERLKELLHEPTGLVLFSAPPTHGLTSTFDAALNSTDRFMRSFMAIEDAQVKVREIENVPVKTYDSKAGETPNSVLVAVARLYPDVIVCRNLPNKETLTGLCDQIAENRMIIASLKAKDCAEALMRGLALGVSPDLFAASTIAVVNQRLIRKLCEQCKTAYAPQPQVLQQLRIPAGKVEAFYGPPQQVEPGKECQHCGGIGYYGRTAFFELLVMDDAVRQVLMAGPKLDALRLQARKSGMRTLQEEGLLLVVAGVTSLQELSRILKE